MSNPRKTARHLFFGTTLVLTSALSAFAARADEPPTTRRGAVGIQTAVIPSGFGSEPVAVISGYFNNSCYRWDGSEVKHLDAKTHEVQAYAKIREGMCLMVMIPYSEEVSLGNFAPGEHTLRFVSGDGGFFEKKITVE